MTSFHQPVVTEPLLGPGGDAVNQGEGFLPLWLLLLVEKMQIHEMDKNDVR